MTMTTAQNQRTAKVIASLLKHAHGPIRRHFQSDSCIASTRIGIDVLDYFSVASAPLALQVLIFNEEAIQLLEGGMTMEELAAHMRGIPLEQEGGPWSMGVGLGGDPEPNKWPGHLVIAIPQTRSMIDLSIEQASRPHKGLPFREPILWHCPDNKWWAGDETLSEPMTYADDESGRRILVMFDTEDRNNTLRDYRRSKNWHRRSSFHGGDVFRSVTAEIIRLIKADLEEA